jgi:hypothetical protein
MKSCPECESSRIHRSRRHGTVERILFAMIFIRPFRCGKCGARFYLWSLSATPQASRQTTRLS